MAPNPMNDRSPNRLTPVAPRRPYHAPRLIVHGTVAELTASKLTGRQLLTPGYLTEA
jgi:hypothetical protein